MNGRNFSIWWRFNAILAVGLDAKGLVTPSSLECLQGLSTMSPKQAPSRLGQKVTISTFGNERVEACIPPRLPPVPAVRMDGLYGPLESANRALGQLDVIGTILPDASPFLYSYVRKEALLSCQIEGTQSTLSDLFLFESEEVSRTLQGDVREVANYVAAMSHGLDRIRQGFPISLRLIREIHRTLLSGTRDSAKRPGDFRLSQNWIGGTRPGNARFVPPPQDRVLDLMSDLERFMHRDTPEIPFLVKLGMIHVQFETIHPFLDGNGRLGRLLVSFLLCAQGILREPILYLSLYLKEHRWRYYELLQQVREHGDWEAWLGFFLEGIAETSWQACEAAQEILKLFEADRRRIEGLGRPAASALRVHQRLQKNPVSTVPRMAREIAISPPTIRKSMRHLEELGIVRPAKGLRGGQVFVYESCLSILSRGAEPL